MVGRIPVGTRFGWVLAGASVAILVAAALLASGSDDGRADARRSRSDPAEAAVFVDALGCPVDSQGMGVVIGPDLVVTNAHVVAGSDTVTVTSATGTARAGVVVGFDPLRDLALLDVADLGVAALDLAAPQGGVGASVLARGTTEDRQRDLVVALEGSVVRTIDIFISDIYGDGRYERRGMELAIDVKPGDSGAGVVDELGNLVGVVFSSSRGQDEVSYAVSALEVEDLIAAAPDMPVDPGVCRP